MKGLRQASAARSALGAERAMELQSRHPQLSEHDNQVEDTSPAALSGGAAGLARVIGKGKRKPAAKKMGGTNGKMESESEMEGGMSHMSGGARQGKMLADHLEKLHGKGFLQDFASGLMSGVKSLSSAASGIPVVGSILGLPAKGIEAAEKIGEAVHGPVRRRGVDYAVGKGRRGRPRKYATVEEMKGAGQQGGLVYHAPVQDVKLPGSGTGGQDVPPGGVAPRVYGNPPQAPASFERNTVGMGARAGGARSGGGKLTITHGGAAMPKSKRAPSARNMMISKLMKEKGMSLPEASKYIKEHGLA